ncbi:cupin domain-containing protein [Flagellimonas aquimarina]|jgi:mannose-6-phosphate isomerase-like protein (cupin superfamily)|uniref:Cupin domain-containing protein n=1 Tax=Flagellimonas aquimarina TaxID=2201895 RepID=A0A316KZ94_9FLAO|nr:cupin domain-containing protein [Allomuricauda koreensis]PWL39532.1 cupin domain-containing protein [Allomuricauda koreensis]
MKPINLKQKHTKFDKQWHPHQIATVDDMQVILAKIKGEFVWHSHENEDELFQVIKGTLYMQFRDRTEVVKEGEIIVVPKGVEHNPKTKNGEEVHLLLFEKQNTAHTGDIQHEMTQTEYPKI